MQGNADYLTLLHGIFFTTTILFMLLSAALVRRISRLRAKIDYFRNQINKQTKDLSKKDNPLKYLKPYESETSKSIIVSVDASHRVTYLNDYAEEFFGFTKEETIGENIFQTIYAGEDSSVENGQTNIIDQILTYPRLYLENESKATKKNGEKVWISWTNRIIYDNNGKPKEVRSVGFDITKRKQLEQQLHSLSAYDSITHIFNRESFMQAGIKELKRTERYNRQMSLIIMRFDFFHKIQSDAEFTDEILKNVIDICEKSIRESDIIGRLNDIEFGFILPETPIENALFFAERLKHKIQEQNLSQDKFFINVSFGTAEKTKDATIDTLLTTAFMALENDEKTSANKKRKGVKK